jgi:hypothetical protein
MAAANGTRWGTAAAQRQKRVALRGGATKAVAALPRQRWQRHDHMAATEAYSGSAMAAADGGDRDGGDSAY